MKLAELLEGLGELFCLLGQAHTVNETKKNKSDDQCPLEGNYGYDYDRGAMSKALGKKPPNLY